MTIFLTANNASTTLAGSINSTATTAALSPGTGSLFPNPGASQQFALTLVDALTGLTNEIVYVTGITGDTITAMVRGQEGTTPRSWLAGDLAGNFFTSGQFASLQPIVTNIGRLLNIQIFSTPGSATYTPTAGATTAIAYVQAAGGQGGGAPTATSSTIGVGTGGHSGANGAAKISLAGVTTLPVTVGAGGSTGAAGASGQAGGSSSLSTLITAAGGAGGSPQGPSGGPNILANSSALPQATFGAVLQILLQQQGQAGPPAFVLSIAAGLSGTGGPSPGYGGSFSSSGGTGTGNPGAQIGAGGSGAFSSPSAAAQIGGSGVRGQVVIYEYA